MIEGQKRLRVDLFGYCLMPNRFHLVLRTRGDGDLGRWVQRLLTAHAQRYNRHFHSTGHVWQSRFKAFPVKGDEHLVTVLRYVERNPVRAELVNQAEHWKWSSLPGWLSADPLLWRGAPEPRGPNWLSVGNEPLSAGDLNRLRHSVERGAPFGTALWTTRIAERLGLESTLRPRRRPRKE
jgi:putative transposase